MKILLLFPENISLNKTIKEGCLQAGHKIVEFDYRAKTTKLKNRIDSQRYRMPYNLLNTWEKYMFGQINQQHKKVFYRETREQKDGQR